MGSPLEKTVLVILAIIGRVSCALSGAGFPPGATDGTGDLFASINGNLGVGGGSIFEFTPGGSPFGFAVGLNFPRGVAFDSAGNLFVATTDVGGPSYQPAPDGTQTTFVDLTGHTFCSRH